MDYQQFSGVVIALVGLSGFVQLGFELRAGATKVHHIGLFRRPSKTFWIVVALKLGLFVLLCWYGVFLARGGDF